MRPTKRARLLGGAVGKSCFGDEESESDEEGGPVRARTVRELRTESPPRAAVAKAAVAVSGIDVEGGRKGGGESQIARLVERRRRRRGNGCDDGDEMQFRLDVAECAEDEETYDDVPVESFGKTMLMRMGWKPKTSEHVVEEPKARLPRLGLGAKPPKEGAPLPPPTHRSNSVAVDRRFGSGMQGGEGVEMRGYHGRGGPSHYGEGRRQSSGDEGSGHGMGRHESGQSRRQQRSRQDGRELSRESRRSHGREDDYRRRLRHGRR